MKPVRTEKQKENLAKFFWDIAKVEFALFVIGPWAKPESISSIALAAGVMIGVALALLGYIIDGRDWSQ